MTSDSRVFVSTAAFGTPVLADVLNESATLGVRQLELTAGMDRGAAEQGTLVAAARDGFRFIIHNYFPPPAEPFVLNLASGDAGVLERSRRHCLGAISLSAALQAPFYSVHCGFACDPAPGKLGGDLTQAPRRPREAAAETFVESLRLLCAAGADVGVRVLIENNVVSPRNLIAGRNELLLGATGGDLVDVLDGVGSEWLGLLVDVGHLKVTGHTLGFPMDEFFDRVRQCVEAFHLSDNDGRCDSNEGFDDQAWFLPRLVSYPSTVRVVEAYGLGPNSLRHCVDLASSSHD